MKLNKTNKKQHQQQHIKRATKKLNENSTKWLKLDLNCLNLPRQRENRVNFSVFIYTSMLK